MHLLEKRAIFLLRGVALRNVPYYVNRALFFRALVNVAGCRRYGEPSEGVRAFVDPIFLAVTIWAVRPFDLILGEHILTQLADDFRR